MLANKLATWIDAAEDPDLTYLGQGPGRWTKADLAAALAELEACTARELRDAAKAAGVVLYATAKRGIMEELGRKLDVGFRTFERLQS